MKGFNTDQQTTDEIRRALYEALKDRRGAITAVARRAKCTRQWVRNVLLGEYDSLDVLNAAAEELEVIHAEEAKKQHALVSRMQGLARLTATN
jgi:hypothetical protein